MNKIFVAILFITIALTGCRTETKKSEQPVDTDERVNDIKNIDVPIFSATTPQNFKNGVQQLVTEIEKSLEGVKPVEKKMTINNKPNTPVKIWYSEKDLKPIKVEQGEANDSGEFTGISRYYFVNGEVWFSDQPFAKYIFESGNLLYWLDENWNVNQITEENMKSREENIKKNLNLIL